MRPYEALIPPFLLESIIPVPVGFLPLSRFFWRGIIWTPEMRGKGVPKVVPFLVPFWNSFGAHFGSQNWPKTNPKSVNFWGPVLDPFFGGFCWVPKLAQNWSKICFFVQFWIPFFWGLGVLWVPLGSLLGPLEALLGGLKSEKMQTV